MAFVVNSVLVYGVDPVLEKEFASFALQVLKIHSLMNQLRILAMILQTLSTHHHIPRHTVVSYVETIITTCHVLYDDDDDEYSIQYREYLENYSNAIAPEEPDNSLSMGDEHLDNILETKSNDVIKFSVEDLVPIPSESEGISDDTCDVPFCDNSPPLDALNDHFELFSNFNDDCTSCDDFSPINVFEEKSVTFSDPLFNLNDDFTSSDDESLSDEDVPGDNVKIYSDPLFEFDDEYISSDVNPLFDESPPLSDSNEDAYFTTGDDVELLLHHGPSTPIMTVVFILEGFIYEMPLEENDDLFDLESKKNEWKKILYDTPIDDLMTEDQIFDPRIHDQIFSPTYVSLPFEDHNYLFFTYVVRNFLPHFTYPVVSHFLLSSGSEDTIFDPGISAFHFSHRSGTFISFNVYLNILNESPMDIFSSTCFTLNITMI
nr:hypothetical protein [Tanacetum cinerariifolium]